MSLRQIAKELGISPAYLSYMLNGKRPWRKDLYQRYMGVVNTFVNSEQSNTSNKEKSSRYSTNAGTKSGCSPAVGRLLWEQEVGSSILPTPTTFLRLNRLF